MASKQRVVFPSENSQGECPAVLIGDVSKTKKGLVVLQEWWGLNEQIQEEAQHISDKGNFVTLVPDLYRGKTATDHEHAGHLMHGLDWPGAVQDIHAATKHLMSLGCSKVGVTGFCMGGALSLASAVLVKELSASAPFYGIPNPSLADLSKICIPLQCHFGELDTVAGFSSPADYNKLKEKLEKGGVNFEFHTYPAGHGFTNPSGPNYTPEIANQALDRMMAFMNKHLQ